MNVFQYICFERMVWTTIKIWNEGGPFALSISDPFHIPDEYEIVFENSAQNCATILAENLGL